ncbi:MAG TPA: hypothetical protein VFZ24_05445 [Longimicrobiales bacterium]
MLELITGIVGLTAAGTAAAVGFFRSRSFVARRLRYVEAVQSSAAPFVAGAAATALAAPVVWLLPIVGAGTAIVFGIATAAGTRAGVNRIRSNTLPGY